MARVYFTEENVCERAHAPQDTTLTAFFNLCRDDEFAKTLWYHQIPKSYTWNVGSKKWACQKAGQTVPDQPGIKAIDGLGSV